MHEGKDMKDDMKDQLQDTKPVFVGPPSGGNQRRRDPKHTSSQSQSPIFRCNLS